MKRKVASVGRKGTVQERTQIEENRRRLLTRINSFQNAADSFYSMLDNNGPLQYNEDAREEDDNIPELAESDAEDEDEEQAPPSETISLRLPSVILRSLENPCPEMLRLAGQEMKLREGQANDALRKLRVDLGHKALLIKKQVRGAKAYRTRNNVFADVSNVDWKVQDSSAVYKLARDSLVQLGASEEKLAIYQELKPEHLKLSDDVIKPNRTGQRSDTLPWIWRVVGEPVEGEEANDWMNECK